MKILISWFDTNTINYWRKWYNFIKKTLAMFNVPRNTCLETLQNPYKKQDFELGVWFNVWRKWYSKKRFLQEKNWWFISSSKAKSNSITFIGFSSYVFQLPYRTIQLPYLTYLVLWVGLRCDPPLYLSPWSSARSIAINNEIKTWSNSRNSKSTLRQQKECRSKQLENLRC